MKKRVFAKQFLRTVGTSKIRKHSHVLVVSNGKFGDFIHSIAMIEGLAKNHDVSVYTKDSNKCFNFDFAEKDFALSHNWDLIIVCADEDNINWTGNVVYANVIRATAKLLGKWKERHWSEFFCDIAKNYDSAFVCRFPELKKIDSEARFIVIHPGASSKDKAWSLENYLKLYLNLKNTNYKPILLVTKYDDFVREALKKRRDIDKYEIYHVSDIKHLKNIASRTKMFIGNDSGVMHYFSLFNCNIMAVFTYGCADTHYPWTKKGFFYFERPVFNAFYKNRVVTKIKLSVNALSKEALAILKYDRLTGKQEDFYVSKELMKNA